MSSPYQCPRHNVALVARVLVVRQVIHFDGEDTPLGKTKTRYFACPVAGCNFKKPDKWQNRKRYDKKD